MGAVIRELVTKLDFKSQGMRKADKGILNIKSGLLKVAGIATAASAAIAAIIVPTARLEDTLRDALILTGETGEAFDKLNKEMTDSAQSLADELGVSATEVAEGFYQVLSTGAEAMSPQFDAVARTAIKFAKTIGISISESVERLNDTLNAFGLEGTEAERVANVFFTASKQVATTVPQLASAMRDAAPAAATMNISLEDTTSILNALAQSGIKGAQAGTAFRQIILKLSKPTKEGSKALKAFNTQIFKGGKLKPIIQIFKDLQSGMSKMSEEQRASNLKALVGEEAFSRLAAILGRNLDEVQGWSEALREADGVMEQAFEQRMDTAVRNFEAMKNAVTNLAAEIGGPFLGSISETIQKITAMVAQIRLFLELTPGIFDAFKSISSISQKIFDFGPAGIQITAIKKIVDSLSAITPGAGNRLRLPSATVPALAGAGARSLTNTFSADITVNIPPGADPSEVGSQLKGTLQEFFDEQNRKTLNTVTPGSL